MIFGIPIQPWWLLTLGLTLFTLLVLQILVGKRKIKFGKRTMVYHKYIAYTILGIAFVHGTLAMIFMYGWRVF